MRPVLALLGGHLARVGEVLVERRRRRARPAGRQLGALRLEGGAQPARGGPAPGIGVRLAPVAARGWAPIVHRPQPLAG